MKIFELTNQLGLETNKELIDFFKKKDFKVSSHMQNITDEMVELATEYFSVKKPQENPSSENKDVKETMMAPKEQVANVSTKKFAMEDRIPCRSVTPWKLCFVGVDRTTVYSWSNFGDTDYVLYRDLQSWRKKDIVTKPKIIIEDPDLCLQWKNDLRDIYKPFIGVDYPEELFEKPDEEFANMLKTTSDTVREIVKVTAMNMVRNKNYPTLQKLTIIDDTLGTCIKEFL